MIAILSVLAAMRLVPALAQAPPPLAAAPATEQTQTPADALAQDAADYARQYGVSPLEAERRLAAQEESVVATDRLANQYGARLAGIFVEHRPVYRIVLLLTGTDPVPDQTIATSMMNVPVHFETGAPATRDAILAAIEAHQADLRATLQHPFGLAPDPRTGMLLAMVRPADVPPEGTAALADELAAIAGVPVEIKAWAATDRDFALEGGGRVVGPDPASGRSDLCTSGFVVTDGTRTGLTTAAHCPYVLTYRAPDRSATPLTMVGAWGAGHQDVQIQETGDAEAPLPPLFYADVDRALSRAVLTWRNRTSTRAGDFVCHRGERSGVSCAEVALVDYAPPGDLCAGPCPPTWVAVRGPHCRGGDSGGPVYLGTTAFGTLKGGNYAGDGTCRFYFYMSTDDLPSGWRLLTIRPAPDTSPPAEAQSAWRSARPNSASIQPVASTNSSGS